MIVATHRANARDDLEHAGQDAQRERVRHVEERPGAT